MGIATGGGRSDGKRQDIGEREDRDSTCVLEMFRTGGVRSDAALGGEQISLLKENVGA